MGKRGERWESGEGQRDGEALGQAVMRLCRLGYHHAGSNGGGFSKGQTELGFHYVVIMCLIISRLQPSAALGAIGARTLLEPCPRALTSDLLCHAPTTLVHTPPNHTPPNHTPPNHTPPNHTPSNHKPPNHTLPNHKPSNHTPSNHTPPNHKPSNPKPSNHTPPNHKPSNHTPSNHTPPNHTLPNHKPSNHTASFPTRWKIITMCLFLSKIQKCD
uniref:Uncharacterized protein n=1 Tax=Knipowitschia caucasica TaxID=637954 RepID=A0AAV2L6P3_KNICA